MKPIPRRPIIYTFVQSKKTCILEQIRMQGGAQMVTKTWNDIKNGNVAPVYLIVGEETYFADETIKRIKKMLGDHEDTEVTSFDLNEQPVDFVIDEADTFPFFSDRKLVIARNATFLKAAEKGKEKIEHDVKRLEEWLNNPPTTAITVFIAPYEKLDERKKITKLMKERSVIIEAKTPEGRDLAVWVRATVQAYGNVIADDACGKLIEMVGENMLQLQQEIDKLCLYVGNNEEITIDVVEELVAKTLEHDAFKMLNAYLENDKATALLIYHDLLRQKEEPIKLVGLLASQLRIMTHVYYMQRQGYNAQNIARQLKQNPYRVQMILKQRNRPSEERLLQALHRLADVDLQLKSVSGNRERYLEMFLLKDL